MNFEAKGYLPNTEKRIKHLQNVVAERPVVILVPGPSIHKLEHGIEKLRGLDICYFGLNSYTVVETHILEKINKQFSAVMCSSREGIPNVLEDIIDFLDRDMDNIFISSFWRNTFELMPKYFDLQYLLNKHNKKFIFFNLTFEKTVPNKDNPLHFIVSNSLLVLIQMAIISKASSIVLFGADGGFKKDGKEWYYQQGDSGHRGYVGGETKVGPVKTLANDTDTYFNPIAPITINNLYTTYDITRINILNCSKNSLYTPFTKVSYDDAFKHLLKEA